MNRREFLRKVCAGAAVAAVVPMVMRDAPMSQEQFERALLDELDGWCGFDMASGPDRTAFARYNPADGADGLTLFTDGDANVRWMTLDEARVREALEPAPFPLMRSEAHMTPGWVVWTKGANT